MTLAIGIYFEYYLTAIGAVLTIISGVMVYNTGSRIPIHDYIAKTTVVGIDEQPPVPKNRKERRKKEINTHKTQDGHFVHLFLRDFYIRSNRKEIRRVGIAITLT